MYFNEHKTHETERELYHCAVRKRAAVKIIKEQEEELSQMQSQNEVLHKALEICAKEHKKEPSEYVRLAMIELEEIRK